MRFQAPSTVLGAVRPRSHLRRKGIPDGVAGRVTRQASPFTCMVRGRSQPPDPKSSDGTAVWRDAGVYVHCWIERNPYFLTHHRDPIGFKGTVRPVRSACGDGLGPTPLADQQLSGMEGSASLDIFSDDYDPYSSGPEDCGDDPPSGSVEGTGSGTQYQPGDATGGETVDWETGIGDGGASYCGPTAIVEYICIDTWDSETQKWVGWSCGYATTC